MKKNYMSMSNKRYFYVRMIYFLPYGRIKNKVVFELNLSNYATRSDLKNATGVDLSQLVQMT